MKTFDAEAASWQDSFLQEEAIVSTVQSRTGLREGNTAPHSRVPGSWRRSLEKESFGETQGEMDMTLAMDQAISWMALLTKQSCLSKTKHITF